jgi:hypothetical protein
MSQDNGAAALDKDVSSLPQEAGVEVLCTTNVAGAEHVSMTEVELEDDMSQEIPEIEEARSMPDTDWRRRGPGCRFPKVVNRVACVTVVTIPGKLGTRTAIIIYYESLSDWVSENSQVAYEDEHESSASEGETQPIIDAIYRDSSRSSTSQTSSWSSSVSISTKLPDNEKDMEPCNRASTVWWWL